MNLQGGREAECSRELRYRAPVSPSPEGTKLGPQLTGARSLEQLHAPSSFSSDPFRPSQETAQRGRARDRSQNCFLLEKEVTVGQGLEMEEGGRGQGKVGEKAKAPRTSHFLGNEQKKPNSNKRNKRGWSRKEGRG